MVDMSSAMFTSNSVEWETPIDLFNELDSKYGFELDVCATEQNKKCFAYFDKDADGLAQDWGKKVCWMNPPYGRQIGKWVEKAYDSSVNGATVVCLLPSRTDTKWFHSYCIRGDITFIKGRLRFNNHKNPAPFPSMVVVFLPIK